MKTIAIVVPYSASCAALAKQCIVSCYASNDCNIECVFYAYQINWIIKTRETSQYIEHIKLGPELLFKHIRVIDIDASSISMQVFLPDIVVYDHFARNYLHQYDYTLFCHDDMCFYSSNMMSICTSIVDKPMFDIVAEPHIECSDIISARFYPHFIFVNNDKFLQSDLSFINNYPIFSDMVAHRETTRDGGSGLMASYYRKRTMSYQPCHNILTNWFTHIRAGNDNGVETFNLLCPNSEQVHNILISAQQYVDSKLYS